uniref:Uncharacterized protein n=1 Tax=Anopheles atroparvus TaxID=41427 RepID=A0AAG5DQ59_ANOAO
MDTSPAASTGTGVCIEIIEGSEIKTEPLEATPEHHSACPSHLDDGVLIEPPQQHIFLRPFPPITSQPVVITASNTDERYVISEIDTADEAPQRVMQVVNVRYQQVLDMAGTNNRPSIINTVPLARLTAPTAQQASAIDGACGSGQSEPESQSVAAEEDPSDGVDISKQPKRGRPPKPLVESEESVDESVTEYKCGYCGKEIHRSTWKEHHASHNGVAFRVGIDEPIDLNDIKAVGYAIMRFMRTNRRNEVICEKCGQVKKSFMGMASHLKTCGIPKEEKDSAKVACEYCGRKMLIVSIPSHHTLYCRVLREQREKEAAERGEPETVGPYGAEDADEQLTARGRQKRRSVACAERKIRKIARETIEEPKELIIEVTGQTVTMGILQGWLTELTETGQATCRHKDCFFVGTSEKIMRTHNNICPYGQTAVPVYECAICLCQDPSRDVVYQHLCQQHPEEQLSSQQQSAQSGDECDANVASGDMVEGSSGTDDMDFDGDMQDEDDLVADGRKAGRKKKQAPPRSRAKKGPPKAKKATASKKGAPPEDDLQIGVMGEEGEVYKEMVYEEAAEYRQQRANIQFTTIQWTFKFMREQYGTRQLFEQLRPDVDIRFLTMLAIRDYLPQSSRSMRFRQRKIKLYDAPFLPDASPDGWQRLGTFQGDMLGSESMFYCGGPVMALDWLPIPSDSEDGPVDQILAVACKSRYEEFYTCQQLSKPQSRKCLIQIWNVGPLRNGSDYENEMRCPQLSFAIACDFGPIWQLAFCPSGCNNETGRGDSFDRLGLLAATGSDGDVYVFALNRSMVSVRSELPATKPPPRIVHLQPVLRLSLTLHQRQSSSTGPNAIPCFSGHSVMRISWTREKGHTVLAAGYSNGIVAVWKLTSASFSSSLLSASKDGIRTLLPTHRLLHASGSSITALDIHYGQGSRFLAVTNADRRVKVYDLHSGHHQPLEVFSVQARSRITAMRWLLHFPVLVFVFDDTFMVDRCGYTVHQPREIGIRMQLLLMLGTEATDLAANDWISTNAITTDGGDLVCHKPIPFVSGIPGKQFGQVLTTTTSVRLNGTNASPTIVSSYDAFYENYGLLFSDTDEHPSECDRKSLRVKAFRRGNIEQYPAVRLNQIRWNPNSSSFLHYAVAYQAGFVRIRKMQL